MPITVSWRSTIRLGGWDPRFHLPKRMTLQILERIDRNVAWWSTSHERTQWQRFKWVSPMHQKTRHAVDRVGFRAGVDTCRACAQENLGRHWHCAEHQAHLCPNCAELQPEVPTIRVGARYFGRIVPSFGLKSF